MHSIRVHLSEVSKVVKNPGRQKGEWWFHGLGEGEYLRGKGFQFGMMNLQMVGGGGAQQWECTSYAEL